MFVRKLAPVIVFGVMAGLIPGASMATAASLHGITRSRVSADRPGLKVVKSSPDRYGSGVGAPAAKRHITQGAGAGQAFCAAEGGYPLGASYEGVYACGPATGTADDFDTVGFQCVELSERFLWVEDHEIVPNVPGGRDFVGMAAADLGIQIGVPGQGSVPVPGDIVSLWGGPDAQYYGHTAVVTSVNVNAVGNGTIGVMEQNAAASGWDTITVTGWSEAYGDPSWGGGEYYYNHIDWLKLKAGGTPPPPPSQPTLQYLVQGLGSNSTATGINDAGSVTGFIQHSLSSGTVSDQPFLYGPTGWRYPGSPTPSAQTVAINDHDAIAAWVQGATTGGAGYAIHAAGHPYWNKLPVPGGSEVEDQTTAIDSQGDVSGWVSTAGTGTSRMGAVWTRSSNSYHLRTLAANRNFHSPVVSQTDHWGDAIGSEVRGTSKTFAVVWAPWGEAFRLPPLSANGAYSVATDMLSQGTAGSRQLTVVGTSRDANGVLQACEWHVTATSNLLHFGPAIPLTTSALPGPSSAVAINASGWVVGNLGTAGTSDRAFLWRPGIGAVDLQTLLAGSGGWVVLDVTGINALGAIVGQAYDPAARSLSQQRGVLFQPKQVLSSVARGRHR